MAGPVLVLYDDATARDWRPLTLTRPAGELRFGTTTLRARAERVLGLRCAGHWTDPALDGFHEPGAAPVLSGAAPPARGAVLYLSSRAVLEPGATPDLGDAPLRLVLDGEPCGFYAPEGGPWPDPAAEAGDPAAWPEARTVELQGTLIGPVWELVTRSADRVARDIAAAHRAARRPDAPPGVHILGEHAVVLEEDVTIEPGVVLDAREGPILLGRGVHVHALTRLSGPAAVDAGSTLLGGVYTGISIGPTCKVHGEMEETVVLAWSNKAHDGFLGHAYLGAWVNLGAMTTNSDLKNNYGSVRVWTPRGEVDTGEMKIGSLLGDHVKTAIGTLLNTGTVVGAGANLFGGMPPKHVPPFSWGGAADGPAYAADRFLDTARRVMARRNVELETSHESMLRRAWERGRAAEAPGEGSR